MNTTVDTGRHSHSRGDDLREAIANRLAALELHAVAPGGALARAAVAVVVVHEGHGADLPGMPAHAQWRDDPALLLTRRAQTLRRHAGQWALPGGRIDDGETPESAALRELAEETGLALGADAVLGRLDDVVTRSGYAMTPVVVWGGAARGIEPNPGEVASLHRIAFSEWLRADAPMLDPVPEGGPPELRMPVGSTWIAAPTAAVLYQFRELCLLGRATRVAHFAQPRFTWR